MPDPDYRDARRVVLRAVTPIGGGRGGPERGSTEGSRGLAPAHVHRQSGCNPFVHFPKTIPTNVEGRGVGCKNSIVMLRRVRIRESDLWVPETRLADAARVLLAVER
jgi:hypothetical protein